MSQSTIHILGVGSLGKLFAHSLRKCHPELPITLLFHRPSLKEEWEHAGRSIEIVRDGKTEKQYNFRHESLREGGSEIRNLICATKTFGTAPALEQIKKRLRPSSSILFLQNGIGTIEEVNENVFSDPMLRPRYYAGIVNHGVYTTASFSCVHAALVDVTMGPVATKNNFETSEEASNRFIETIVNCPSLVASSVSGDGLLQIQLRKLAVNAVINPLSASFDCINGDVFQRSEIHSLVTPLVEEISAVIQATIRSNNPDTPAEILSRFESRSLEDYVTEIGIRVAKNSSSMRQDVRAGRRTEIDYINGYILKQGEKFGIPCPVNIQLVQTIKSKSLHVHSSVSKS
ncbi:2-dehydropantoate 2-reductase-like protein [Polyplosphaeria fusca]|uniref:2-dehydropantoate 2-reductase n=1 Tax=Polyplosphaeria fusca TaxID=682080 RepID=A0A9P4R5A2_9PLEO|nr:2-dehydropantoate 2-reductase-like protein [Polyplosphaeria fusca]